ncbi:hypothetical protein ANN_17088 [Periplaneta americana]|uniref:Per a allergen n=1 Tax=Periplaneta americana TaxID=6978 RepID=A0ABQ8ST55_PERAM|nr:hypothetical protein ANN_17088 [Periplaneta americana]
MLREAHGACASGTFRVLSVASFHWLKMDAPIPAPDECEVLSVKKLLNEQSIAPIEIYRQLCQIYGPNIMSKQMAEVIAELTLAINSTAKGGPLLDSTVPFEEKSD